MQASTQAIKRRSKQQCFKDDRRLTDDDHVDDHDADVVDDDAELEEAPAERPEGVAHGSAVGLGARGAAVAHEELDGGVREHRGEHDEDEARGEAEHLHGGRERHDPRADDGGGQVEHRAGEGRAVEVVAAVVPDPVAPALLVLGEERLGALGLRGVVAAARDRHHHPRGVARDGGAEARLVPGEVRLARTEFQLLNSSDPSLRKKKKCVWIGVPPV